MTLKRDDDQYFPNFIVYQSTNQFTLHIRACKITSNREWMYLRLTNGLPNQSFISRVEEFVQFALSRPEGSDGNHIRCPCNKNKC